MDQPRFGYTMAPKKRSDNKDDSSASGDTGDTAGIGAIMSALERKIDQLTGDVGKMRTDLAECLSEMKTIQKENVELQQEVIELRETVSSHTQALEQQQLYLEALDSRHRAKNLVLFGVDETEWFGCRIDEAKVKKVFQDSGEEPAF